MGLAVIVSPESSPGLEGTSPGFSEQPDQIVVDTTLAKVGSRSRTNLVAAAWILTNYRLNPDNEYQVSWNVDGSKKATAPAHLSSQDVPFSVEDRIDHLLNSVDSRNAHFGQDNSLSEQSSNDWILTNGSNIETPNWTVQCIVQLAGDHILIRPVWLSPSATRYWAMELGHSFSHILNVLLSNSAQTIAEVIVPSSRELDIIWNWNKDLPPRVDDCMHTLISSVSETQPEKTAVVSWDGQMSYGELEAKSSRLAQHLINLGIGVGSMVPLLFEKSMWTVVGLLAVMKAGAGFVLTDPSQPQARLQTITEDVEATVMLTSKAQAELCASVSSKAERIIVDRETLDALKIDESRALPKIPGSAVLYVIFTSGSTGKPKGVVISHSNYTSGALPRALAVGYNPTSRVLDFASYAFDVSIDCMLCTLVQGGTICVPSVEQRVNDISGAIRDMNVNMAHMTPSVARVLDPDVLTHLDVLGLGGESVSTGDAAAWGKKTNIVIAYGPSECTVGCTINNSVDPNKTYTTIGKGVGGSIWVVDPDDHDRLVPPGAVGELLVEGPIVGLGYLKEPEKTRLAFIEDPVWLIAGHGNVPGRGGPLYKTGDLVKYDPHGCGETVFVGRKDSQVKLRGQRVELGEIEYHLRIRLPQGTKVAAEVIKPEGGAPTLVAFVESGPALKSDQSSVHDHNKALTTVPEVIEFGPELKDAIDALNAQLSEVLPIYMVPTIYIPLSKMPIMISNKTDRKTLRQLGTTISLRSLGKSPAQDSADNEPQSPAEIALSKLWCRILNVQNAGRNDNFYNLGGDSIAAMKLVSAARAEGFALAVAEVLKHPTLLEMASILSSSDSTSEPEVQPFSLLAPSWSAKSARAECAELCGLAEDQIVDIYPCTPLQEGLMALSAKVNEAYVAQRVMDLPDHDVADRLKAAWDKATGESPILRTRIVHVADHGLMQVIVRQGISWSSTNDLKEYLEQDRNSNMDLGKALARYAIVTDSQTGKISFVWTTHHALYDGWSVPLVVDRVNRAYKGLSTERPAHFNNFIKYLNDMDREASKDFWRLQLHDATGPHFPTAPSRFYTVRPDSLLERYVSIQRPEHARATTATIIRAAWALVVSKLLNTDDCVFGETITGRTVPIIGVEEIEGPMITTIPTRIKVDKNMYTNEYLQTIHDDTVRRIPHEHYGLQHIRRVSPDALAACDLKTGLVIQPNTDELEKPEKQPADGLAPAGDAEAAREALKFNSYGLMLVCTLDSKGFLIMASFDSKLVEVPQMQRILAQLELVCLQLAEEEVKPLRQIQMLSASDREEIWQWNKYPSTIAGELPSSAALTVGSLYSDVGNAWIVDQDSQTLLPIGAIGELLIERNCESSAYTDSPQWLLDGDGKFPGRAGRLHRTGDLAKYNHDGSVIFMGRKDSANGTEDSCDLGEISKHMVRVLPQIDLSVEYVTFKDGNRKMAVFLQTLPAGENASDAEALDVEESISELRSTLESGSVPESLRQATKLISTTQKVLRETLPAHMLPSTFIPVKHLPTRSSTNYSQLLKSTSTRFSFEDIKRLNTLFAEASRTEQVVELSPRQTQLQKAWAQLLGIDSAVISLTDSFFLLGGDSIMAMKLVSSLRSQGLSLTVADMFKNPTLSAMSNSVKDRSEPTTTKSARPFSALDVEDLQKFMVEQVRPVLANPDWRVVDVLPVNQPQKIAIGATINKPKYSVQYNTMYFESPVDQTRLFKACQTMLDCHDILRTVFIRHNDRFLQVVLEKADAPVVQIDAGDCADLNPYCKQLCTADIEEDQPLGSLFVKFFFVKNNNGQSALIIRISHAQYDGFSLPRLLQTFQSVYNTGKTPKPVTFAAYMYETLRSTKESIPYWRKLLHGSNLTCLRPDQPYAIGSKSAIHSRETSVAGRPHGISIATLVTAAWTVMLAKRQATRDITFGQLIACRRVNIPDCETILGPCYSEIPGRIVFQENWTLKDVLQFLKDQVMERVPHEATSIDDIKEHCVDWPRDTYFDHLLNHQEVGEFEDMRFGDVRCKVDDLNPDLEPSQYWRLDTYSKGDGLDIHLAGPDIWGEFAEGALDDLVGVIGEFVKDSSRRVVELLG